MPRSVVAWPEGGTREVPGSGCGACGASIHAGGRMDCGLQLAPSLGSRGSDFPRRVRASRELPVASCQIPDWWPCMRGTPEALQRIARGAKQPRVQSAQGGTYPGGVAASRVSAPVPGCALQRDAPFRSGNWELETWNSPKKDARERRLPGVGWGTALRRTAAWLVAA
jgi:hypothetical protein